MVIALRLEYPLDTVRGFEIRDWGTRLMRILVVDDEPDVLLLCRVALSFDGHEVLEASDATQGLARAVAERPDLLVLDVMLPGEDGISLLRELKGRPETRGIPVILLTARASGGDQVRGWEAGASLYIAKPFSPAALSAAVARIAAMTPEERTSAREQALRHLEILARP